jgi:uroporphyrinogen-III synthase
MTTKSSLNDRIIITTQPADQVTEMLNLLTMRGAKAFNLPMIETKILQVSTVEQEVFKNNDSIDIIVFTSRKGVIGFFDNLKRITGTKKLPNTIKFSSIGKATTCEIENHGFHVDYPNPGKDASDLVEYLITEVLTGEKKILLALGTLAPDFLKNHLSFKANVKRVNVYQTLPVSEPDPVVSEFIVKGQADICIFTSPSGFQAFSEIFRLNNQVNFAAIGNTTASFIENAGFKVAVTASDPTAESMINSLEVYFEHCQDK